jgi:N-methylhydantoinase B
MIDAVTLEVARHRFAAIAAEMGSVLRRTSLSPNIKERADCSAAVFTAGGEMLAQAEHIPVHLGSMPESVRECIERFDPAPGEQYAVNDPFAGGTHLNDLTLVAPVFIRGRHVAWVANRAHHADVGGEAPGSMPAHATTVDQEGHRVPPTRCVADGAWLDEFVIPFVAASRTPWERRGDLDAQMGANAVAARRMAEVVASEGLDRYTEVTVALLEYGERRMRAALAALPDGSYRFTDHMEHGDHDVAIRVEIRVDGETLTADFAGTDPQVEANFNAVEAVTRSCLYYAVRVATDPTIPTNGGCYRPIQLSAPPGTLVNALPPAAVAAGNVETSQRIADVVLGALAQAAPDRVPAASQGTMNNGSAPLPRRPIGHPHRNDQHPEHANRGPPHALPLSGRGLHAASREWRRGNVPGRRRYPPGDRLREPRHSVPDGGATTNTSVGVGGRRTGSSRRGLAVSGRR